MDGGWLVRSERGDVAPLPHHCTMTGNSVKLSWWREAKMEDGRWAEDPAASA